MKQLSTARIGMPISFLSGILGIMSVLIVMFFGYKNGADLSTVLKLCVLSIVLLSIVIFYLSSQLEKINELPHFYTIFILTYIGSLLLIMAAKERPELTVWMAGGLLIAMLFNMYLGYILTYNFIFFASFAGGLELEFIVYLLILGTFMCLLSGYMKKITAIGYAAVIILSMQLILIFIINNFMIKSSLNITAVYSLVSSLLAIGISYGAYTLYRNKVKPDWNSIETKIPDQDDRPDDMAVTISADESIMPADPAGTRSMDEILDKEFPLLQSLKQYSLKVYNHSLLISELSQNAAKAVEADEYKAKAGGLYHEIGRIANKEYVEEGVKLAQAYGLPGIITDIIRQHNIKYEKPKSPEAAIVMIAISVTATKEYLEKVEKSSNDDPQNTASVPIEKIVDNVFQMRLAKGSLDESGLTLKQYNKLKEFFLHTQI